MITAPDISRFFADRRSSAPLPIQAASSSNVSSIPTMGRTSSTAASKTGTLQNWNPRRITTSAEAQERENIALRAMDLVADDPHVSGLVESMSINTVGIGYKAQSRMNADQLPAGLDVEKLQRLAEWNYFIFSKEADIQGTKNINDIFLLAERCELTRGEYLILPRMVKDPSRTFGLCLQVIDPLRLCTPSDLISQDNIIDGVEINDNGEPEYHWIMNAGNGLHSNRHSKNFTRIKTKVGHRPQVLHGFVQKDPEQYRGYIFFAPAMKFFRDLSDHLDAELVSNIVTSAAAMFVASPDPTSAAIQAAGGLTEYNKARAILDNRYEEVEPGAIYYGNPGEKPEVLEHNRPGSNFVPFVETILRAASFCGGIPYEVAFQQYGNMNYATARAALLDAWRVFKHKQNKQCSHLVQPVWNMVMEEAHLTGQFEVPNFYTNIHAYTRASFIPQTRGNVDPVKEMRAAKIAKDENFKTHADIIAEMGGDWELSFDQRAKEQQRLIQLKLEQEKSVEKKEPAGQ